MQSEEKKNDEAKRFSIDTRSTEFRFGRGGYEQEDGARGQGITYTMRVILAFALVSFMTALVSIAVLSYVWEQHFQTYTRENMQNIAETTAQAIGARYSASGGHWYSGALDPASSAHDVNESIGVRVVDANGDVLYDDSRTMGSMAEISLAPTSKESLATADIITPEEEVVGAVQVWVYGSNTLLTQADQEFKNHSYQAMIYATIIAVCIAMIVGILFARSLVDPINKITRAAKAVGEGDLSARTNLEGDDEISNLGMTFDVMAESVQKDRQLERRLTTDVAHELRTPLMSMLATVEAMQDGVYACDQEHLALVRSEITRLSRLVDGMLSLSRLENGSVRMDIVPTDAVELVAGITATHKAMLDEVGLDLRFENACDTDELVVELDRDTITQAVTNFISNAMRYTPAPGTVTVRVRRDGNDALISVQDTGIGIAKEDISRVFGRFWRAEESRNRAKGGLGVGLAVTKEIVDRHHGKIEVDSTQGVGTTFTLRLPLKQPKIKQSKED